MLALLLVALSLGLDNFAASVAIGMLGVDRQLRLRIALAFGLFEAAMPVVGLLVGRELSSTLGSRAHLVGGALLIATGAYTAVEAMGSPDAPPSATRLRGGRLLLLAASLSIDNLIVGFALGAYRVSLALAVAVIAVVSVGLSLLGLELGGRLGARVAHDSEVLAGVVLICVGAAVAADIL